MQSPTQLIAPDNGSLYIKLVFLLDRYFLTGMNGIGHMQAHSSRTHVNDAAPIYLFRIREVQAIAYFLRKVVTTISSSIAYASGVTSIVVHVNTIFVTNFLSRWTSSNIYLKWNH